MRPRVVAPPSAAGFHDSAPAAYREHSSDQPPRSVRRRAGWLRAAGRTAVAAASGALVYLSFAPISWWWAAVPGLAGLYLVLHGRSLRAGLGYGFVFGMAMMLPLLWWTGEFVGVIGSVPLATMQAVLVALSASAITAAARLPGAPLWAAAVWVAGETLRSVVPFGGFPWAKVAFGQVDGVFLPLAAVGSTALVGFAVALVGFCLAALLQGVVRGQWRLRRTSNLGRTSNLFVLTGVTLPVVAGWAAGGLVDVSAEQGRVTVAAVQGDVPRAGLDFNAERRAVLDNHVQQTLRLAADVRAGRRPQPDVVLWPENSSDIDPFTNPDAYVRIQRAARAIGVPILVGAVVDGGTPRPRNTVVVWEPGRGPTQQYTKRRLQPFGETMPLRGFFRLFSSDVDRAGSFVPGNRATVLDVAPARMAITLCYEVIFDGAVRDSILNGANLLVVPSNNATFGYTDMTYQQLAIDRFRAVEHSRAVVVPTTSGVSAVISPDGRVVARTGMFEPATLVESVPLRSSLTLSDRLGSAPEWAITGVGVVALLLGLRRRRVRAAASTLAE